ncbi:hypothetical protein Vadar_023609 [Vaccinium darrowii]|uniref:Uncharacterized protein n=1 Tax=Vaccinium darrowii TaxID=229202 RepID=A0ACB7YYA0_9ERIC|nr:hypothetical protein Vadar_023609 [Vaccinium darrowii]
MVYQRIPLGLSRMLVGQDGETWILLKHSYKTWSVLDRFKDWECLDVNIVPVLARPDDNWIGEHGYVQAGFATAKEILAPRPRVLNKASREYNDYVMSEDLVLLKKVSTSKLISKVTSEILSAPEKNICTMALVPTVACVRWSRRCRKNKKKNRRKKGSSRDKLTDIKRALLISSSEGASLGGFVGH